MKSRLGRREPFAPTSEFRTIASAFGWGTSGVGVGDDAARVGERGLLCCDAMAEGVHFRRDWSSLADVGWKIVAQNVADVLAMGGIPTEAVWSVGMGADWTRKDFRDLARGASQACEHYGCRLVGGDTVRTTGAAFVSLALQGELPGPAWLRSGARAGDRLVLLGTLGTSAAGLALLERGGEPPRALKSLLAAHRRPTPPLEAAAALRNSQVRVHAAIDISDGLSSEAHHLAAASACALVIEAESLPLDERILRASAFLECDPWHWVWNGGEEHSLLLALPADAPIPTGGLHIGVVREGKGVFLGRRGRESAIRPRGWVHRL